MKILRLKEMPDDPLDDLGIEVCAATSDDARRYLAYMPDGWIFVIRDGWAEESGTNDICWVWQLYIYAAPELSAPTEFPPTPRSLSNNRCYFLIPPMTDEALEKLFAAT
jgi:hypothetical protein